MAIAIAIFAVFSVSALIGLTYAQASLAFGGIAALSAPVVIHKIPDPRWAAGILMMLSIFASFPLKKLFQIDGFVSETTVTVACAAALWVVGFGWKRRWS